MAVHTIYATLVESAEFADAADAQGEPAAGASAPYATRAIAGAGTAALSATFAALAVHGTITAVAAILTCRSTQADTELVFSRSGLTFIAALPVAQTNFALASDGASFSAATLKADLAAGLSGLVATFTAGAGATVDAKGFGLIITYTPDGMSPTLGSPLGRSRGRGFRGR